MKSQNEKCWLRRNTGLIFFGLLAMLFGSVSFGDALCAKSKGIKAVADKIKEKAVKAEFNDSRVKIPGTDAKTQFIGTIKAKGKGEGIGTAFHLNFGQQTLKKKGCYWMSVTHVVKNNNLTNEGTRIAEIALGKKNESVKPVPSDDVALQNLPVNINVGFSGREPLANLEGKVVMAGKGTHVGLQYMLVRTNKIPVNVSQWPTVNQYKLGELKGKPLSLFGYSGDFYEAIDRPVLGGDLSCKVLGEAVTDRYDPTTGKVVARLRGGFQTNCICSHGCSGGPVILNSGENGRSVVIGAAVSIEEKMGYECKADGIAAGYVKIVPFSQIVDAENQITVLEMFDDYIEKHPCDMPE